VNESSEKGLLLENQNILNPLDRRRGHPLEFVFEGVWRFLLLELLNTMAAANKLGTSTLFAAHHFSLVDLPGVFNLYPQPPQSTSASV
jgi:hypothetical protein